MRTRSTLVRSVAVVALIAFVVAAHVTSSSADAVSGASIVQRAEARQSERQQQPQQPTLQQLSRQNFLVGIAAVGARHDNGGTQCGKELEMLLQAVSSGQQWTQKVLDSFGQPPRSFSWGNYFWFEALDLCEDLNVPFSISFAKPQQVRFNITSPWPLRATLVYLNFSTPYYIDLQLPFEYVIHLGLCLPASCHKSAIMHYTQLYFESEVFELQRNFELQLQPVEARTPRFSWSILQQTSCILFSAILALFILFMIAAELLHKSKLNLQLQQQMHTKGSQSAATQQQQQLQQQQQQPPLGATLPKGATFERLLLCFRLPENIERATLLPPTSSHNLGAISGLRTIVCLWVGVFHVYYYCLFSMTNAPLVFAKLEQFALQPVMQACFYVDVFFVISAFLLVYNFLCNETQMKCIRLNNLLENVKLFGRTLLHRYLRLTPVMVIVILLSDMTYNVLNIYSPFRLGPHSGIYCKRNWWYNLLYIHNLLDMKDICCSWTWYLACEMQYFVLFTALLFVLAKNPRVAKITFAALALGFVVTGWLCNYRNGITFHIDTVHGTLNQLYVKPWMRINPYIGGAAFGWLLHRSRQRQPQQRERADAGAAAAGGKLLHAVCRVAFWLLCALVYATTNFMSYWRSTPSWLVAAIMSFGKLFFALCVGGVIALCAWGHGGPLNTFLSARIFLFLDKFCFSVYLVAPMIVFATFGLRNEATSFNEVASSNDFLAINALAVVAASLLLVLVELPMTRISNEFVRSRANPGQQRAAYHPAPNGNGGAEP